MDQIALSSRATGTQSTSRELRDEPQSKRRSRRTNNVFADLDLNSSRGRRVADLVRSYLKALGDPYDAGRQAAVIQAAELQVLAEEARTAALREPETADLDALVRIQGAADRALRRLGIKPGGHQKPETLAEYLAKPYAAPAAPPASAKPTPPKSSEDPL
jgi:hypothetical protein